MLIPSSQQHLSRYAEKLTKLTSYALEIALLCYLMGFAITNMYLGSLGIVNLEILKARYILSGLVFLLFITAISYLVYGLIQCLRINRHLGSLAVLRKVADFSLMNLFIIFFAIVALAVFAGPTSASGGASQLSLSSWQKWLETEPIIAFRWALGMTAILGFAVVLIFVVLVIINPANKHGIREPRRQALKDFLNGCKSLPLFFLGGFGFSFALYLVISLIGLVGNLGSITLSFLESWFPYFGGIALIYLFFAVYLTFVFVSPLQSSEQESDTSLPTASLEVFLAALCIVLIVPASIHTWHLSKSTTTARRRKDVAS